MGRSGRWIWEVVCSDSWVRGGLGGGSGTRSGEADTPYVAIPGFGGGLGGRSEEEVWGGLEGGSGKPYVAIPGFGVRLRRWVWDEVWGGLGSGSGKSSVAIPDLGGGGSQPLLPKFR